MAESEESYLQRTRKRSARAIQGENPGMKYTTALRQVIASESSYGIENSEVLKPEGLD